jgi:glycosyltransferase involved in cell wall biosynthesis
MKQLNTYICGCVRDCEKYLRNVFKNIKTLISMFDDYQIVIAYDMSSDNTMEILKHWTTLLPKDKLVVLINQQQLFPIRTQNISNARNALLNHMRDENTPNFEYCIMMDMDDVCAGPMNKDVLETFLDKERAEEDTQWDALTFNRKIYYDIWALSLRPYVFSCWNFSKGSWLVDSLRDYVHKQLKVVAQETPKTGLLYCESAFNGFGLYRRAKFEGSTYEWNIHKNIEIIPQNWIQENEDAVGRTAELRKMPDDCEHRHFHIRATQLNGAKICISPLCLF